MCPLCDRPVEVTRHHAKLKRRDSKLVLGICKECQQTVHGLYPGTTLARRPDLWTIEGLRNDPAIARALIFVKKIKPGGSMRMREAR